MRRFRSPKNENLLWKEKTSYRQKEMRRKRRCLPGTHDPDSSSSSVFHAGDVEAEEAIVSKEGHSLLTDSAGSNFGVSAEELAPSSSLEFEAMDSKKENVRFIYCSFVRTLSWPVLFFYFPSFDVFGGCRSRSKKPARSERASERELWKRNAEERKAKDKNQKIRTQN